MYGFAVSGMAAIQISELAQANRTQTAENYYFQTPGVALLHNLAGIAIVVTLLTLAVWIAFPKIADVCRSIVLVLAVVGITLVWTELMIALTVRDPRFLLEGLPFKPINNLGLAGATVFASYLILKLPPGYLKPFTATLIKVSFAVGMFILQLIIFEKIGIGAYA